jgi:hypothetical protein
MKNDMPKMGTVALNLEANLHGVLCNTAGVTKCTGGKGTGIIVVQIGHEERRVFKVELSQVEGPP